MSWDGSSEFICGSCRLSPLAPTHVVATWKSLGNSDSPCIAAHALQHMLMEPVHCPLLPQGLLTCPYVANIRIALWNQVIWEPKQSHKYPMRKCPWLLPIATLHKTPMQVCGAWSEEQEQGRTWAFLSYRGHLSYPLFSFYRKKNL